MFWIDYWYVVLVLPAVILALAVQIRLRTTYSKYSAVRTAGGITAEEAARRILNANGLYDVAVERVSGDLTDHYDPRTNTVRLSEKIYGSCSVAAVGVAAHEVGHAIQHAKNYFPMKIRSAIIPMTNFGAGLSPILLILGFLLLYDPLIIAGIVLYSMTAVFQLVTLPVEFNASRRALGTLSEYGIISEGEKPQVRRVLSAAAMTYVASLLVSLMSVLRLIMIFGGGRGRNRR